MKEPSLTLSERIDIQQQGRLERAVREIDPCKVVPLRPLIRISRRYKHWVGRLLRERWPTDHFEFKFYDNSFCYFVVPKSWWRRCHRAPVTDTPTLLEIAQANERGILLKLVDAMDERAPPDPILQHAGHLDPDVTLRLLQIRYPRDRFGYTRLFSYYEYRFYLRR